MARSRKLETFDTETGKRIQGYDVDGGEDVDDAINILRAKLSNYPEYSGMSWDVRAIGKARRPKPDRAAARQAAQEKRARDRESARRQRIDKLEGECKRWEMANAGHEADVTKREAEVKTHRDAIMLEQAQIKRAKADVKQNDARCRVARKRLAALRKG